MCRYLGRRRDLFLCTSAYAYTEVLAHSLCLNISLHLKKPQLLHHDQDLLIVSKPPFYLSLPDRFDATKPNLLSFLKNAYGDVFPVHRLDKETSGVICFARNEQAHKALNQQFQDRTVQKKYWVLLDGIVHPTEGNIEKPIAPHPAKSGKMMVSNKGKASLTHYRVIEQFRHFALVEADIKTGRTHQIRVHFESLGYPLMVDKLYGIRPAFFLSQIKRKKYKLSKDQEERPLLTRSSLHAHQLTITHPTTKESITFTASLPKDFHAVLKQLQKWDK